MDSRDEKLERVLTKRESAHLRRYTEYLIAPNADRALILAAHAIVEHLLGEMIETQLRHPNIWLEGADFKSRRNLARAMALIGEEEVQICTVLQRARNHVAHSLEPLSGKWTVELVRLANASGEREHPTLLEALHTLVSHISAPWLYARVQRAKRDIFDTHQSRWLELMKQRLVVYEDPIVVLADTTIRNELVRLVNEELAEEMERADADDGGGELSAAIYTPAVPDPGFSLNCSK